MLRRENSFADQNRKTQVDYF